MEMTAKETGQGVRDGRNGSEYRTLDHRWADGTVTWSFADQIIPNDARQEDIGGTFLIDNSDGMRGLIRDAFDAWEAICGIDFVEVRDNGLVDIRVGWASRESGHADGQGGVLGTYIWDVGEGGSTMVGGRIVLDHDDSGRPLSEIYDLVLREVGHAVGLDHSDIENVVMSGGLGTEPDGLTPYWGGVPGRDPLQPDDIAGAVALWGEPEQATEPETPPGKGTPDADTLIGGEEDDDLTGLGGPDVLLGGWGSDLLVGGAGDDRIWGGHGDDTLRGDSGEDLIFGEEDSDWIEAGAGKDRVLGGGGHDDLRGDDGDDLLWGEAGRDTIVAGSGHDFAHGGPDNDTIQGAGGRDYLAGGSGDDWLYGGSSYDILNGGIGDDTLLGGRVGDTFFGGKGEDRFELRSSETGDAISWIMDYEPERDEIIAPGVSDPAEHATQEGEHLRIDFEGGAVYLANTRLADVGLLGGSNTVLGTSADERIAGTAGNDTLWGRAGADTLVGDSGDDLLHGEEGPDTVYGGEGQDTLLGGREGDSLRGDEGDDEMWGGSGQDTLEGGSGHDTLQGETGNDSLAGGGGMDSLVGGEGDDELDGGTGHGTLEGGSGDDTLRGGGGTDILRGGEGADLFVLGGGEVWIIDYEPGTDRIQGVEEGRRPGSVGEVGGDLVIQVGTGTVHLVGTTVEDMGWMPEPAGGIDWF